MRDNKIIDVSQYMNLQFGFEDLYDLRTYTLERMMDFGDYCDVYGETVLDLRYGNMSPYERYKGEFFSQPALKFQQFMRHSTLKGWF